MCSLSVFAPITYVNVYVLLIFNFTILFGIIFIQIVAENGIAISSRACVGTVSSNLNIIEIELQLMHRYREVEGERIEGKMMVKGIKKIESVQWIAYLQIVPLTTFHMHIFLVDLRFRKHLLVHTLSHCVTPYHVRLLPFTEHFLVLHGLLAYILITFLHRMQYISQNENE